MRHPMIWFGAVLLVASVASTRRAEAQAVAFQPNVATIPDGVAMTAVPAVSADRRYVRLSVNPSFQTVDGFQNIGIPFGVAGQGSGTGAGAGAAALAGAGFPGAGGFRSVGVPMGMNGPVVAGSAMNAQAGVGYGTPTDSASMDDAGGTWSPVSPRTRAARLKATRARKAAVTASKAAPSAPVGPKTK